VQALFGVKSNLLGEIQKIADDVVERLEYFHETQKIKEELDALAAFSKYIQNMYAVNGAKNAKTTPVFKESDNSASPDMDFVASGEIPRDPKDMSEDQLEELMQNLMVDRGVIASGEVPQKRLS
jgi:hypothetical protein